MAYNPRTITKKIQGKASSFKLSREGWGWGGVLGIIFGFMVLSFASMCNTIFCCGLL
jgi:hypothetical protein